MIPEEAPLEEQPVDKPVPPSARSARSAEPPEKPAAHPRNPLHVDSIEGRRVYQTGELPETSLEYTATYLKHP